MLKNFLDDVLNLLFGDVVIHHSHATGEIFGYAHDFCNQRVKECASPIPVIAHDLIKFDFFFVLKGLRLCVWGTKNINIGARNLTDVQYANLSNQLKFIDTIEYYQQPLPSLAANSDEDEKRNIRKSCLKFIRFYSKKFNNLSTFEQNWYLIICVMERV